MSLAETILAATVALAILWPAIFGRRPRRGAIAVLLVIALVLDVATSGYRWQVIPMWIVAVGLAAGDVIDRDRRLSIGRRFYRGSLGLLALAAIVILPYALPVPKMPSPGGPFEVGTFSIELVDAGRKTGYGPTPDAPRRLMAQVWYPTGPPPAGTSPVPWEPDIDVVGPAMSRRLGFPPFFLSHTARIRSHSYGAVAPAPGPFPLVVYSHGWTGFRLVAADQMEMLASHGYVVIALDHTYGAIASRFPDGEVAYLDPSALPDRAVAGEAAYDKAATALVATFSDDLRFLLDQVALGPDGPFPSLAGVIDLSRIGIYGHSTGGGAAVRTCLLDNRCVAVGGLDAWVEPISKPVFARDLTVPAMFMRSDGWRGTPNDARLRGLVERSGIPTYWLGLVGAGHNDFVVMPFLSPFAARLGLKGPIPATDAVSIVHGALLGFFDATLKGGQAGLLAEAPPPHLELERLP